MKTVSNMRFISSLLILSIIFSSLAFTPKANAVITRQKVTKMIKWGTIAGVAAGAVIGAATLGFGGLFLGAGAGALVSSFVASRLGVQPTELWKLIFPHGLLPFKYKRQNQTAGNGSSLPSASQMPTIYTVNRMATHIKMKYTAAKQKYTNTLRNGKVSASRSASEIKQRYEQAYRKYINAVQRGKSSAVVRKTKELYQKAKARFQSLFKR